MSINLSVMIMIISAVISLFEPKLEKFLDLNGTYLNLNLKIYVDLNGTFNNLEFL